MNFATTLDKGLLLCTEGKHAQTLCCGWDNVCVPQGSIVNEAWSPECQFWEVEPLRGGAQWEVRRLLGECPWKGLWEPGLSDFLLGYVSSYANMPLMSEAAERGPSPELS